jgi:transposase
MDDTPEPRMDPLFDVAAVEVDRLGGAARGRPRLQRPVRDQVMLRSVDLEALLPEDHRARLVWAFTEGLDLSAFHARIRAVEGHPGRPPIDPAILVALWLYAALEGVGSARALARLCEEHDAYRWLCGGVGVNHHTLADFRVAGEELLQDLLAQSVAALLAGGHVTLDRVAHDGLRVRASAGASSYRGRDGLARALGDATEHMDRLRVELDADPAATSRRIAAARERAARERLERVRDALDRLPALEAARHRKRRGPEKARVSTTDPAARILKMGDGGYRPGWNAQFTTDVGSGVVVAVGIGGVTDAGCLRPAIEAIERRHRRRPREALADGGHVDLADIAALSDGGTILYAPPKRRPSRPPRRADHPAVAAWRTRMETEDAKTIYRQRASTAEWVNAQARERGLQRLRVRGARRVGCVLLWFALAHNLVRTAALRGVAGAG